MSVMWGTPYHCPQCGQLVVEKESEAPWMRVAGGVVVADVVATLNTSQTINVGGEFGEHHCPKVKP